MAEKPVFRPSFGNRPEQLVGRDAALEQVLEGLESYPGSAERATLVLGQRGMGKTAFLLELADRARDLDYIVARTTCSDGMLDDLIAALDRASSDLKAKKKKKAKKEKDKEKEQKLKKSFTFHVKLQLLCERLAQAGKKILLVVDEVDPASAQLRELVTAYQELATQEADIALVMAALPSVLASKSASKVQLFMRRAQQIELDRVPQGEIEAYYRSAFPRAGLQADDYITSDAAAAAKGSPYLMQLLGYYLVKFNEADAAGATNAGGEGNEGDGPEENQVTLDQLARAKTAALDELDLKMFQTALAGLSDGDINFLKAMARDDGPTKVWTLESRLGWQHGTVQTYRARLLKAGVVVSPRRGELAFALPALADYLRNL